MDFAALQTDFAALIGVAALITVIINILKMVGVVKDGTAQTWSAGLNLAGMAGLLLLRLFRPEVNITELDNQAGQLATVITVVTGYVIQLGTSKLLHGIIKDVPLIGTSNTTAFYNRMASSDNDDLRGE